MTTPGWSAAVEQAIDAVVRTQAEVNDLELTLEDRTSALGDQIRLLGMEFQESGVPADRDLIRRLYWDTPSLSAQVIYEAFALRSPHEVYALAGAREFQLPCKDCGIVSPTR